MCYISSALFLVFVIEWSVFSSVLTDVTLGENKPPRPGIYLYDDEDDLVTQPNSYPVRHAALPTGVVVYPIPLIGSDHELMFNVTWNPPLGPPVRGYSLEVHSMTNTVDCHSNLCYEYNIPGDVLWSVIPMFVSPIPEGCAVRPGCAYSVKVIAHPWDGHTSANINVELDECVAGVCSCSHAPRLPTPEVTAQTISIHGDMFVNVTWSLPPPQEPLRLPPRLRKLYYLVSIAKKMVPDAHPAPWYANITSDRVDTFGFVAVPDDVRWHLLPVTDRGGRRGDKGIKSIVLDVKLLARVNLVDERGCVGPVGSAIAYDPDSTSHSSVGSFILWATFGGACVFVMIGILAISTRAVKRILRQIRSSTAAAPLQPLCTRPIWFQLNT